jgi:hypothetical protein
MEKPAENVRLAQVVGHPAYWVGDDGSVWSSFRRMGKAGGGVQWIAGGPLHRLKPRPNRTGYLRVVIFTDGNQTRLTRMIHHLVLEAFIGPCPDGMEGCHGNDVKSDNRFDNLRWDTKPNNWIDRKANGRVNAPSGENHPMAKLTWDRVNEIRSTFTPGRGNRVRMAQRYGITKSNLGSILRGEIWRNDPPNPRA